MGDQSCRAAVHQFNIAIEEYNKFTLGNACELGGVYRTVAGEVDDMLRAAVSACSGIRELRQQDGGAFTPEALDALAADRNATVESAIAKACKPAAPPPARTAVAPPKPARPPAPEPTDLTAAMKKCFAEDVKTYTDIKTADQARAFCTGKYAALVKGSTVEQLGAAWDAALPVLAFSGSARRLRATGPVDTHGMRRRSGRRAELQMPALQQYLQRAGHRSLQDRGQLSSVSPLDAAKQGKSSDIACTTKQFRRR